MRSQSLYILFWAIFCSEVVIPRRIGRSRESESESDSDCDSDSDSESESDSDCDSDNESSDDISESRDLYDNHGMSIESSMYSKNTAPPPRPKQHKRTKYVKYITLPPPVPFTPVTPDSKLPKGPFFGFLKNICDALISPKFKEKYLGSYFHILGKSLRGFGINFIQKLWIRRFRRKLEKYSIYNKKTLKLKTKAFLDFISDEKPRKIAYFEAMDAIYTINDDTKMDDYVYLLKNYGKGTVHHIGYETRRIFERIIFGKYNRLDEDDQAKIKLKFKSALVEYWQDRLNITSNYNSTLGHLFNYTLNLPRN